MVNYGAGLCLVKSREYIAATVVGIIPGTFAFVYLGSSLTDLRVVGGALILFILLVRGPLLFRRYLLKRRRKDSVAPATERDK